MNALTQPRRIEGAIQTRSQAEVNGELWDFAGRAEDTVHLLNDDKVRLRAFMSDVMKVMLEVSLPECRWYEFRCKREVKAILTDPRNNVLKRSLESP